MTIAKIRKMVTVVDEIHCEMGQKLILRHGERQR